MSTRIAVLAVAVAGLCVPAGCESLSKDGTVLSRSPIDEPDPTEDGDDEWAFVGNEARGNQMLERDPDPWWQKYLMSPKARSIERNVGIAQPGE